MKKAYYVAILFAGLMMSCVSDDIDKLTDINIPFSIEESVDVDLDGSTLTYSDAETFKLEALGQITSSNIGNVEKVSVDKIAYTVSDFDVTEDNLTVTLTIKILDVNEDVLLEAEVKDANLSSINGQEQTLTFSSAQSDAVSAYLLAGNEITVITTGTVNDTPVKFTLDVTVDGTVVLDVV